uniref:V-SNARE domain-containing protein n=1 Tax=Rhabditophanes sp. KR3021 TaxID=114890 RepID=A0AC35U6U9_9BILA
MTSISDLLNQLQQSEQFYSVATAEITSKIGQLFQKPISEQSGAVQNIQTSLNEVSDLLDQMEMLSRDFDANSAERAKYELRIRSYRSDKKQLDLELQKSIKRITNKDIYDELVTFEEGADGDLNEKLINNTARIERGTRKIQDSYRVAIETEEIGATVLQDLATQRETINRARERLRETDANLLTSNRMVSQMIRRLVQNRLFLIVIIGLLLLCFLFLMYRAL